MAKKKNENKTKQKKKQKKKTKKTKHGGVSIHHKEKSLSCLKRFIFARQGYQVHFVSYIPLSDGVFVN